MEITNTENKNLFQQLSSLGFDVNESLLELEKDYSPVEEIGMQNVEIIDSAEEAIQQPLVNTDSSIAVNFSQMINKPEEVKTELVSTPDNGEAKVNVVFPKNEHILGNYVDYESFNKIKEST